MWTAIKSLDPRTFLAFLRRRAVIARLDSARAEPGRPAAKPDCYGTILSYDNVY
jgi:hypothetical protein